METNLQIRWFITRITPCNRINLYILGSTATVLPNEKVSMLWKPMTNLFDLVTKAV